MNRIIEEIKKERQRQDDQWGGVYHDDKVSPFEWVEVIGKLAQKAKDIYIPDPWEYRRRLMQVAAVAVAACESYDRAHPKSKKKPV